MADVIPFGRRTEAEREADRPALKSVTPSGTLDVPLRLGGDEIATFPDPRSYLAERLDTQPTISTCRSASAVISTFDEMLSSSAMSEMDAVRLLRRMRAECARVLTEERGS